MTLAQSSQAAGSFILGLPEKNACEKHKNSSCIFLIYMIYSVHNRTRYHFTLHNQTRSLFYLQIKVLFRRFATDSLLNQNGGD